MTIEKMKELLGKDEKITVEYKACQNGIHDDVFKDTHIDVHKAFDKYLLK